MKKSSISKSISRSLISNLYRVYVFLPYYQQRQLLILLGLMIVTAFSEAVSLGAVFPFLTALGNAQTLLDNHQLQPVLTMLAIDSPQKLVICMSLAFMGTVIIANGLRLLTLRMRVKLGASIGINIGCQIYRNILRQSYSFHVAYNSSKMLNTVTQEVDILEKGILSPVLSLFTDGILTLVMLATLLAINSTITLLGSFILTLAYLILYRWRRSVLIRNSQIIVASNEQRIKTVQEGLGSIREILLHGNQNFFEQLYQEAAHRLRKAGASNVIVGQSPRYFIESLAISGIAFLAIGWSRYGNFSQAIPTIGSIALGANRLLPALQSLFASVVNIQSTRASLNQVVDFLELPVDPLQQLKLPNSLLMKHELRFENVWFRYKDESNWVLQGLDFSIQAHTTVAFVGSTGSGKSTTSDLILGLLMPQQGSILLDGQPLEGERLRAWQSSISHVPQSIYLTDASIAENIAFGIATKKIDLKRVEESARLAHLHEFIEQLPAGYETYVGEWGVRLSGGQRQRLGIARALYRQASVIVFDEATSALDNVTEQEVMTAIHDLSHRLTIIMIAHRLSTVKKCDCIFELEQGRLISSGTFEELMKTSTTFRSQSLSLFKN